MIRYSTGAFAALLLWGCSADGDDLLPEQPDGSAPEVCIRIASSTAGPDSRAVADEPRVPGQCNADRLTVFVFRGVNTGYNGVELEDIKYVSSQSKDIVHYSEPGDDFGGSYYQGDKWARDSVSLNITGMRSTAYAFPALAYSKEDRDKFMTTESSGSGYSDLRLKLKGIDTPELYFGRTYPNYDGAGDLGLSGKCAVDDENGIQWYSKTNNANALTPPPSPLGGKLYRIVSQINVTINDVDTANISKMELYVSNLPVEIGLYAKHREKAGEAGSDQGYHYPVVAANEAQHSAGPVIVASTDNFRKKRAQLSAFLLPSDKGRSLTIRVYDKKGGSKDYELRPPRSYYMGLAASEWYLSTTDLCVYNQTDNLFYSYSNVRVNISGAYENFFADKSTVDVAVEICPGYSDHHEYTIN